MKIQVPSPKENVKVGDTVTVRYRENGKTKEKELVITTVDRVNGTAYGNERKTN